MKDFYEDLFEELSKYGDIESLNICDNLADHMVHVVMSIPNSLLFSTIPMDDITKLPHFGQVGNVYVQFREEEHAANALKNLTGRYYAGINLFRSIHLNFKFPNGWIHITRD